jgi:hypothetical protein
MDEQMKEYAGSLVGTYGNAFLCRAKNPGDDDYEYFLAYNTVQAEGMEYIVGAALGDMAKITQFYLLLKDDTNDPFADGRTYEFPGFVEITTELENLTRPEWTTVAPYYSAGVTYIDNDDSGANWARFEFNDDVTVYGIGLVGGGEDPDVLGDTAGGGVLVSVANFASSKVMADDGTLDVMYRMGFLNCEPPTTTTTTAAPTTTTTTTT